MKLDNKPDPERIGPTAVMCAKYLAENSGDSIPYVKDIWNNLKKHDEKVVSEGKDYLSIKIPRPFLKKSVLRTILEGRYIAVNNVLANENYPHVIELASGLSPRGLDFTRRDPKQIYIETDLLNLQKIKRQIVKQIRGKENLEGLAETPNYYLTPLNITDKEEFTKAIKPYIDSKKDKPLAIVHSGLWMYLDSDEQKKARDNIADILREYSPNGMWITTDFRKSFLSKNLLLKLTMRGIEKKTGRRFRFYESEGDIKRFLTEGGLKAELISSDYLADSLSCVKKLGLDVEKVRQNSHMFDVHKITLA